mgnify:CR=1 FL=1
MGVRKEGKSTFNTMATLKKGFAYSTIILLFASLASCSTLSGGNKYSDDPAIRRQREQVESLKRDLKEAERYAEEAKQREKAARDRLKAAEHELKALEEQAKRRSEY